MEKLLAQAPKYLYSTGGYNSVYVGKVTSYMHKHPMARCLLTVEEIKLLKEIIGEEKFSHY